jgi:deoxycytidine triphosphate deaminase
MGDRDLKEERARLEQFGCPIADGREDAPIGVLLSDEIKRCVTKFRMIEPFDEVNLLKPAGYELTIGDEFILGGVRRDLKKDDEIRIRPFDVVVIKTAETINLPRFLIARWNVRVKWAYEGLLWVGAAQVDPGWVGHLFCPIYNLSNKEVVVRAGDPIALMDFVTTTPFRPGESKEYRRPPKRPLLSLYASGLRSALYDLASVDMKNLGDRVEATREDIQTRVGGFQDRIDSFVSITLGVLGVVVAAVALSFGKPDQLRWWDPSVLWVSALAIFVAALAWVNSNSSVQWFGSSWKRIVFELVIFAGLIIAIASFAHRTQSEVDILTQEVRALKQQIPNAAPNPVQSSAGPPRSPTPSSKP